MKWFRRFLPFTTSFLTAILTTTSKLEKSLNGQKEPPVIELWIVLHRKDNYSLFIIYNNAKSHYKKFDLTLIKFFMFPPSNIISIAVMPRQGVQTIPTLEDGSGRLISQDISYSSLK